MGMAQKTRDILVGSGTLPISSEMQFLASTQNAKELCYQYKPAISDEELVGEIPEATPISAENPLQQKPAPHTQLPVSLGSAPVAAASIADVPISAEDVVCALVAQKLKRAIEQIPHNKSIKELSGGRRESNDHFFHCNLARSL